MSWNSILKLPSSANFISRRASNPTKHSAILEPSLKTPIPGFKVTLKLWKVRSGRINKQWETNHRCDSFLSNPLRIRNGYTELATNTFITQVYSTAFTGKKSKPNIKLKQNLLISKSWYKKKKKIGKEKVCTVSVNVPFSNLKTFYTLAGYNEYKKWPIVRPYLPHAENRWLKIRHETDFFFKKCFVWLRTV